MAQATVAPSPAGRRFWRPEPSTLLMVSVIGLAGLFVVYPIVLLLLNSFNEAAIGQPARYGLAQWRDAFASPALLGTLGNTILVFIVRQTAAFPIAIGVAWLLARTNLPHRHTFEFMFWVSFFLPALSIATGWMLLLDPNLGLVNQWLRSVGAPWLAVLNIYSFWGIIWVHLMAHAISIKVMLLTPGFRLMDGALEEASRTCGASSLRTLLFVTIPVLLPELLVVALLSALRMFESYEIEQLIGTPFGFFVYSTKLVALTRETPPLYGQATALGSLTLGLVFLLLMAQRRILGRRSFTTVTSRARPTLVDLGKWRWPLFSMMLLLVVMLVVVPLIAGVMGSLMTRFGYFSLREVWTLQHWQMALGDGAFLNSLRNTVVAGLATALIAPILFSLVAYLIARTRLPGRSTLDVIAWLPQAIPGVLTGLALLWLVLGTPLMQPIYGSISMLVIAFLVTHMPVSVQLTRAALLHLSAELEEASQTSGAGWWHTYRRIVFPLLAPTLATIAVLQFILAAQNIASVTLLGGSENRTLALLALDFVREGLREAAAVYTTIVVLLTTGLAIVVRQFGLRLGLRSDD